MPAFFPQFRNQCADQAADGNHDAAIQEPCLVVAFFEAFVVSGQYFFFANQQPILFYQFGVAFVGINLG